MAQGGFAERRPRFVVSLHDALERYVEKHSVLIAKHQSCVSHPWLDAYFSWTSVLGSHTFFMLFLPLTYQIVDQTFGRILILSSALAVVFTAMLKDYFCVHRPISPPVRRIVVGSHHLEYGFPSTHSSNCITMSIVVYYFVLRFRHMVGFLSSSYLLDSSLGWVQQLNSYAIEVALIVYVFTIVYGRIYLGMHSVLGMSYSLTKDCMVGIALGVLSAVLSIWVDDDLHEYLRWGNVIGMWYNHLITVPISLFVAGLLVLIVHPIPVQPCPCYDDVVCFVGAFVGVAMGNWRTNNHYYEDMERLNGTFMYLASYLSPSWQYQIQMMWDVIINRYVGVRLLVSVVFSVAPLVLWKIIATPIIKKAVPIAYRRLARSVQFGKPFSLVSTDAQVSSSATLHGANKLRRRTVPSKPESASRASHLKPSSPSSRFEEIICQGMCVPLTTDFPRLLVYTGIGFVGAGISYYLNQYFGVQLVQV